MASPRQQPEFKGQIPDEFLDFSNFIYLFNQLPNPHSKDQLALPFPELLEFRETYVELKPLIEKIKKGIDANTIAALENFLKIRWERIRGTAHCYTQPDNPYSQICKALAHKLSLLTGKHPFILLMPSLSLEKLTSPITYDTLAKEDSCTTFVLSDDEMYPIDIVQCLDYFEHSNQLHHTHKFNDKGGLLPLSDTESHRVINQSVFTQQYYNALKAKKHFFQKGSSIHAEVNKLADALNKGDAFNVLGRQNLAAHEHEIQPGQAAIDGIINFNEFLKSLSNEQREVIFACRPSPGEKVVYGENFKEVWLRLLGALGAAGGVRLTKQEYEEYSKLPPVSGLVCVYLCANALRTILGANNALFGDIKNLEKEVASKRNTLTTKIKDPTYRTNVTYKPESSQRALLQLLANNLGPSSEFNYNFGSACFIPLLVALPKTLSAWNDLLKFLEARKIGFLEWGPENSYLPVLDLIKQYPQELKKEVINKLLSLIKKPQEVLLGIIETVNDRDSLEIILSYIISNNLFIDAIKKLISEKKLLLSKFPKESFSAIIKIATHLINYLITDLDELNAALESNITDEEKNQVILNLGPVYLSTLFNEYKGNLDKFKLLNKLLPYLTSASTFAIIESAGKEEYLTYITLNLNEFLHTAPTDKIKLILDSLGLKVIKEEAVAYAIGRDDKEEKTEKDKELKLNEIKRPQSEVKTTFRFLESLSPDKFLLLLEAIGPDRTLKLITQLGEIIREPNNLASLVVGFSKAIAKFNLEQGQRFLALLEKSSFFQTLHHQSKPIYSLVSHTPKHLYKLLVNNLRQRSLEGKFINLHSFILDNSFITLLVFLYQKNDGSLKILLDECTLAWLHDHFVRLIKQGENKVSSWPALISSLENDVKIKFNEWTKTFSVNFPHLIADTGPDLPCFVMARRILAEDKPQAVGYNLGTLITVNNYFFTPENIIKVANYLSESIPHLLLFLKLSKVGDVKFEALLGEVRPTSAVFIHIQRYLRNNCDESKYVNYLLPRIDRITFINSVFTYGHGACQEFVDLITPTLAAHMFYKRQPSHNNSLSNIFATDFPRGRDDLRNIFYPKVFMYYLQILLKAYIQHRSQAPEASGLSQFFPAKSKQNKVEAASILEVIIRGQPEEEDSLEAIQCKALNQGGLGFIYGLYKEYKTKYPQYYEEYLTSQPGRQEYLKFKKESAALEDKTVPGQR